MATSAGHPGLHRALAVCVGAAFAALVLLPVTGVFDTKAVAALVLAGIVCLALALVLTEDGPGRLSRPPTDFALAWGAVALAFLVCSFASPYRALVAPDLGAYLAAPCVGLGLACGPRAWGRAIVRSWRWAVLALAAYAVAQRFGFEPVAAYARWGSRQRAMASFGNPGYLAGFLCLSWPLFLDLEARRRTFALGLMFAALVATQSRAGLLAALVQGTLLLCWRGPGFTHGGAGRPRSFAWVLALGLGVFATAFFFPVSQWMRPTLRWPLWKAGLGLWLQRPVFGWGPGTFALAFQDHAPRDLESLVDAGTRYAEDPHQLLLALACSCGALGLLAAAFASLLFFRRLKGSDLPEAGALGLGVLGLVVESQADRFFFMAGLWVPLGAAFGLLAWREAGSGPAPAGRFSGAAKTGLAWTLMGLTFAFAWTGILALRRSGQGLGPSLDAGVGVLAVSGDSAVLDSPSGRDDGGLSLERLGDALAARRDYSGAAAAFQKAFAVRPTRGRAQNLGDCFMMLGQVKPAEAAFRLAVRLEPRSADAHFSLGYALFYEKRLKESVAELDTALRLDPSQAGAAQLKRQILQ